MSLIPFIKSQGNIVFYPLSRIANIDVKVNTILEFKLIIPSEENGYTSFMVQKYLRVNADVVADIIKDDKLEYTTPLQEGGILIDEVDIKSSIPYLNVPEGNSRSKVDLWIKNAYEFFEKQRAISSVVAEPIGDEDVSEMSEEDLARSITNEVGEEAPINELTDADFEKQEKRLGYLIAKIEGMPEEARVISMENALSMLPSEEAEDFVNGINSSVASLFA